MRVLINIFVILICSASFAVAFAQFPYPGNDSEVGVSMHGFPNYYTGNLSFVSKDLVVAGAVGKRGLSWGRRSNSRTPQAKLLFGLGHNWTHNWQWEMVDDGTDSLNRHIINVYKPSGQTYRFVETSPGIWSSSPGVKDRLIQRNNKFILEICSNPIVDVCFIRKLTSSGYQYLPTEYKDEQGNTWRFFFSSGLLTQIVEPAGRWIKIQYKQIKNPSENGNKIPFIVISQVTANNGEKVVYNYIVPDDVKYPILESVDYPDGKKAFYTYEQQIKEKRQLLVKAEDPRGGELLRGLLFNYRAEKDAPFGQIKDIQSIGGGTIMALYAGKNQLRSYTIQKNNGSFTHRFYNAGGNIAQVRNELGIGQSFEYTDNGRGLLVKKIDELDNETVYKHNELGKIIETIYPDGTSRQWEYDYRGRVIRETDELGNSYVFRRDKSGRLIQIKSPGGGVSEISYNHFGQIISRKDPDGNLNKFKINKRGLCTSIIDSLGNITYIQYDKNDHIEKIIDPLGNEKAFKRDLSGRVVETIYPDGAIELKAYDDYGNIIRRTDPLGNTRISNFDEYGRIVLKKDAEGNETYYEYGPLGQKGSSFRSPVRIISPGNKVTSMVYDDEGRVIATTTHLDSGLKKTVRYNYDAKGRKTSVINELGERTTYHYDSRDRIVQKISAKGNTITYGYNAAGLKDSEMDPNGHVTCWSYNNEGKVIAKIDSEGRLYQKTYFPSGRQASLIDPKGNTYYFKYNAAGQKIALIYPDNSVEKWTYNAVGKKKTYTNRAGKTCTFTYDNRNRLIFSQWSDGSIAVSRKYDAAGRVISIDNGISNLTFQYDKNNRILSETQDLSDVITTIDPAPKTILYEYGSNGKLKSMNYPGGSSLAYQYTDNDKLEKIILNGNEKPVARYTYDAADRVIKLARSNLIQSEYSYDEDGNIEQIQEKGLKHNLLSTMSYEYDNSANPVVIAKSIKPYYYQNEYQYDTTGQVIGEYRKNIGNTALQKVNEIKYDYDMAGNRVQAFIGQRGTPYTTNIVNEYRQVGTSFTEYDKKGNLTRFKNWSYQYDALNRLVYASNGTVFVQLYYDAKNRMVAKKVNGKTTLNIYNAWNLIEERNDQDQLMATYVHGIKEDELLTMINYYGKFYPHYNALGSVTMLTDQAGNIIEQYHYSAFGKVNIFNFRGEEYKKSTIGNQWMFTGRQWLQALELYNYRNRMYSPELGRFLQTDPLRFKANDMNMYRYAFNNPIRFRDPYGLKVIVYCSDALGMPGMNHVFVYSTETKTGAGRSGVSGTGTSGNGVPTDFDLNNPKWNKPANYREVTDLNGYTEAEFINYVKNHPGLNDGIWIPYINDCHTDLEDAFASAGVPYPGAPNDRMDLDDWFIDSLNNNVIKPIYDLFESWKHECTGCHNKN